LAAVAVVAIVAAALSVGHGPTAMGRAADEGKGAAGPRYTVIETQGFNLLVTDNNANKLYYYATDKDAPLGASLKLRASLDLSQVGNAEISIKAHNLENIRRKDEK
jgi:hypothetical protein